MENYTKITIYELRHLLLAMTGHEDMTVRELRERLSYQARQDAPAMNTIALF